MGNSRVIVVGGSWRMGWVGWLGGLGCCWGVVVVGVLAAALAARLQQIHSVSDNQCQDVIGI